jgi:putative membrane protein
MGADGRWPRMVYGTGSEPDPRFSFANERTFLAWIRTAVALLALGVALEGLGVPATDPTRLALVTTLVVLGILASGAGFLRWARVERALRQSRPLPSPTLASVVAFGLAVVGAVVVLTLLIG